MCVLQFVCSVFFQFQPQAFVKPFLRSLGVIPPCQNHVDYVNATGFLRTADHVLQGPLSHMPPPQRANPVRGAMWKRWTPQTVARVVFQSSPTARARHVAAAVEGASARHSLHCRSMLAHVIAQQQLEGLEALKRSAETEGGAAFPVVLLNCMFDETKLPLLMQADGSQRGFAKKIRSVLASHGQLSWLQADASLHDLDIIRAPRLLGSANAPCMWEALTRRSDCNGILEDITPSAEFKVVALTTDSGSANLSFIKHLEQQLPHPQLLLWSPCLQHRTGNVVEVLVPETVLTSMFCAAATFTHGEFWQTLLQSVEEELEHSFEVHEVWQPHWTRSGHFEATLLNQCYVRDFAAQGDVDGEETLAHRQQVLRDFLNFFPTSWHGPRVACICFCVV